MIKTYLECSTFNSFEQRFKYLLMSGTVGEETFGCDRYLNQKFYKSQAWITARRNVIFRDHGCDMGVEEYQIPGKVYIHHINPITAYDIQNNSYSLVDPNNLICVSLETHNAIHYGNLDYVENKNIVERYSNDQCPWKKKIRRT